MLMFSVFANAQNKTLINTTHPEPVSKFKKIQVGSFKPSSGLFNSKPSNALGSAWFNQVDFIEFLQPSVQVFSAMHLFPDSTIILGFGSGNSIVNPYIHKAATYIDPSFLLQQSLIIDKNATYVLDSTAVGYLYERHTDNSIKDSLVFQVIGENHGLDYTLGGNFPYQDITYN